MEKSCEVWPTGCGPYDMRIARRLEDCCPHDMRIARRMSVNKQIHSTCTGLSRDRNDKNPNQFRRVSTQNSFKRVSAQDQKTSLMLLTSGHSCSSVSANNKACALRCLTRQRRFECRDYEIPLLRNILPNSLRS